jgi:hypothetical protein
MIMWHWSHIMRHSTKAPANLATLFENPQIRRSQNKRGESIFSALDIVGVLSTSEEAAELWKDIKRHDPDLARHIIPAEFPPLEGQPQTDEGLTIEGVLRLIQSVPTSGAQPLKNWLARTARQHLIEAENPEMLALRARRLYEQKGYSRRWIDKRLRGVSARQELTSEWHRRGASDSEQFRDLTNRLMQNAFGMDVEQYRRYKNLTRPGQNLRDHMSDLELALTTLGETAAVALHQARNSNSFEQLRTDNQDAGQIVAQTRQAVEAQSGRPVIHAGNHIPAGSDRRSRSGPSRSRSSHGRPGGGHPEPKLADQGPDMHNPSPSHTVRTVA